MKSLRIREIPSDFIPLQVNISPGRCKLGKVILCIDVQIMVYNMTQTVLLYVAVEAGSKMQKMVFAELNCHVL